MLVGLFGTVNFFSRWANYFLIAQTAALQWLLQKFEKWSVKLITGVAVRSAIWSILLCERGQAAAYH